MTVQTPGTDHVQALAARRVDQRSRWRGHQHAGDAARGHHRADPAALPAVGEEEDAEERADARLHVRHEEVQGEQGCEGSLLGLRERHADLPSELRDESDTGHHEDGASNATQAELADRHPEQSVLVDDQRHQDVRRDGQAAERSGADLADEDRGPRPPRTRRSALRAGPTTASQRCFPGSGTDEADRPTRRRGTRRPAGRR